MIDIAHLTPEELAACIDHTFLGAGGEEARVVELCEEAVQFGFYSVMVNPAQVVRCVQRLSGTNVIVGTVIGFPLGQNTLRTKDFEAREAIDCGARELDFVINQRTLKYGTDAEIANEMRLYVDLCRSAGIVSKVILGCCNLSDVEKARGASFARSEGVDFVKTSTGFGSSGATVEDVRLLRSVVGFEVGVKASGGIKELDTALAMLLAGATRLGTSSGVRIVEEFRTRFISAPRA